MEGSKCVFPNEWWVFAFLFFFRQVLRSSRSSGSWFHLCRSNVNILVLAAPQFYIKQGGRDPWAQVVALGGLNPPHTSHLLPISTFPLPNLLLSPGSTKWDREICPKNQAAAIPAFRHVSWKSRGLKLTLSASASDLDPALLSNERCILLHRKPLGSQQKASIPQRVFAPPSFTASRASGRDNKDCPNPVQGGEGGRPLWDL